MSKWIMFQPHLPDAKRITRIWSVVSIDGHHILGAVKWYPGWRRYCFYPSPDCVFEQDCLRDIADFISCETSIHKANKRVEVNNAKS